MRTSIQQELSGAYQGTTYLVTDASGEQWPILVGQLHPDLDAALAILGARSWAFLTACNPLSKLLSEAENFRRMASLRGELEQQGYLVWEGCGVGEDQDWPAEPSVLVLGITRPTAMEVALRHEQLAYVYGEYGTAAELVWTLLSAEYSTSSWQAAAATPDEGM